MKIWKSVLLAYFGSCLKNNIVFRTRKSIQKEWNNLINIGDYNRVKSVFSLTPEQITQKIKNTPGMENWILTSRPDLKYLLKPPRSAAYLKRKYKLENFPRYKTK